MARSFTRLRRVLELEKEQGYENKAVVGGIRQFNAYWVGQARTEANDELDALLIEQVADVLTGYDRLPGKEARAKALDSLFVALDRRDERLGSGKKAAPAEPAPTPKPEPQPQPEPQEEGISAEATPPSEPTPVRQQAPPPPHREPKPSFKPAPEPVEVDESMPQPPSVDPDPEGLRQPITAIKGVGPKMAEKMAALDIHTVEDLLFHFPRRYDDYTLMKPINRLEYGENITVIGTIWQTRARRTRNNQVYVQSVINDGTASVQATWFNQPWLTEKLQAGMQVVLSGKVEQYLGRPVFNNPDWEPLELEPLRTRRIVPIYPLTQGISSHKMREITRRTVSQWADRVPDPLPADVRERQQLFPLASAIHQIHYPKSQNALSQARQRLVFDELFLLQLGMQGQRAEWQSHSAEMLTVSDEQLQTYIDALPFPLTGAQQRVIGEIRDDMATATPMNRLLQGDVGAGKTVVAAAAMVIAAWSGAQAALMAPTEILAEQHYQGLSSLLEPLGLTTALLTGSTSDADRALIYTGLSDGSISLVIGTHALIQDVVTFKNLGLAVIDEQHRFGVDQRAALREKGGGTADDPLHPHLLVMSATPIPRTLALSLYGDLDLSSLDEMPPGRQEIKTRWLRSSERERAYNFVRKQINEGRQAFIIYPLVEESDKIDALGAVEEYAKLQESVFPHLKIGLVHGRLSPQEKEAAMRAFHAGETQILVATSVIEVGVDVPNASVMVIEGANRFGLAQLHQFRGRVGRGQHQSYCILIADDGTSIAEERLKALEQTNDGFVLAEKDLEIRGPGEFFGRKQSGIPELQMASLLDLDMLTRAQEEASRLFAEDPQLAAPAHAALRERVAHFWEQSGDIS